jgi:hypothetical protein
MCVGVCCPSSALASPHHPVLWIVIVVKFLHAMSGLYMWVIAIFMYVTQFNPSCSSWEYFTTLDYEWRVIRGRLPYRWTIWVRAFHFGFIRHALLLS